MTQQILVAGAGIAGLTAAMALANPERHVVVLDRDPPPPDTSPEEAFYGWERKGATQLRHSHVFLGRLVKLIRTDHPRLWSELLEAGAREFTFEDGLSPHLKPKYKYQAGDEDMSMLFSRRTTLELIMRRYAQSLPGVTFLSNVGIRGITTARRDGQLAVTGLRVDMDGHEQVMEADIVVDATGRTTQFPDWLATEGVTLDFTPDGITRLAHIAFDVNERTENIGARRLSTVMERLLDEISFAATNWQGQTITIDAAYVDARLGELSQNEDLSRYIL